MGRGADLSRLNNIFNTAVVLGLLIGMVGRGMVDNRGSMVSRGSVVGRGMVDNWGSMVGRGRPVGWRMVYNRGSMVCRGNSMVSYHWGTMDSMCTMGESCELSFTSYQGNKSKESKCLHVVDS